MHRWHIHFPSAGLRRFRAGVSLHSHTLHSRESMRFIYRAAATLPPVAALLRFVAHRYARCHGRPLDLNRMWWTPPLGPHQAFSVERAQIESLSLNPLVSLTDHDDIEAPVGLQIVESSRSLPVSFEWTVPWGAAVFHFGVHHLDPARARSLFRAMQLYTRDPRRPRLLEILSALHASPETLIVFNHPLWDEEQAGPVHRTSAIEAIRSLGPYLHALELNGLRPWRENREVIALAHSCGKPVVSGGDRHGREPNAIINVSNARTFGEFAAEVRQGWSDVLLLPHYREPHAMRILRNVSDILRPAPDHARGWTLWSDRIFYEAGCGRTQSLTALFHSRPPAVVNVALRLLDFAAGPGVQRLVRRAMPDRQELSL